MALSAAWITQLLRLEPVMPRSGLSKIHLRVIPRWVNFRLPNQDLFTNDIGKTVGNVVFKGWFKRTGGLLRKLLASAALLFYCIALLPRSEAQTSPGLDKNVDGLVQDEMR